MEYRDLLGIVGSWADGKWRGSVGRRALFVKKEETDKVVKICLADMLPECLE